MLFDAAGNGSSPGAPFTQITTERARQFAKQRVKQGFSTATVNPSLACLRRMLQIAHEDSEIQHVPKIRLLKEPPAREGLLVHWKVRKVATCSANPLAAADSVPVLAWSAIRRSRSKVDLTVPCIRLEEDQTKNDETRIVPLPPVLIKILKAVEPKTGRVFGATNLRTEWGKACEAVGLGKRVKQTSESGNIWYAYEGLIVQDLRRSAICNLVNAGENVAMKISGHKTACVFRKYRIVGPADVVEAMQKVVANTLPPKKVAKRLGEEAKRFGDSFGDR